MEKTEEQIKKEAMDNIKDVATKSAEARFEEMKKEHEATFETLAKAQELKDLNEKVTNLGVELKKQAQFKQENEKSTFNENIAKAIQENAEAIKNHKRGSGEITLTMKAVGDMSIGNNFVGATPFIQDVRTNLIAQPFNRVWLADLMPQGTSSGNSVLYPKEKGGEGGVGAWDGTGEKPQVDYDFESQSAFFKWIAGYVIVEREMLDDIPWLISYLQNRLLIDLKRAENDFVLNGRTGTNPVAGLLATAKAYDGDLEKAVDRIIDSAYGQAPENTFDMYTGNIAVLNPRDIVKIGLNKADGSGEYDLPGDNVRFNNGVLNIGGINAVSTTGITKNDFLTFDRNATMFLRRMSPEIRMFEDAELAKVNKVMFRVEERVTQVIFNDEALVKGDFTVTPAEG